MSHSGPRKPGAGGKRLKDSEFRDEEHKEAAIYMRKWNANPERYAKAKIKMHEYYLRNKEIIKAKNALINREAYRRLKLQIILHYSPEVRCAKCGYSDIRALSVDHVSGGGNQHRKITTGNIAGYHFYRWLAKNGFPPGFQILCMNCQFVKQIETIEIAVQQRDVIRKEEAEKARIRGNDL